MSKLESDKLKVAILDPTMKNNDEIVVTIDKNKIPVKDLAEVTLIYNDNVKVVKDNSDEISLLVNVSEKNGSTCEIEFLLK